MLDEFPVLIGSFRTRKLGYYDMTSKKLIKRVSVSALLAGILGLFLFPFAPFTVPALYHATDAVAVLLKAAMVLGPLLAVFGGALGEKNPKFGGRLLMVGGAIELGAWFGPIGWVLGPVYFIFGFILWRS